ncbi:MAG: hypothetical protein RMY35_022355 [Nostoc sp. DedSLP01]
MILLKTSKSATNIRWNQQNKKLQTYTNTLLLSALSITTIFCTGAILAAIWPFLMSVVSAQSSTSFNPTSIPWIHSKFDCEYSGRDWSNNQCWDKEHSPMF